MITQIQDNLPKFVIEMVDVVDGNQVVVESIKTHVIEVNSQATINVLNATAGLANTELKPVNFSYGDASSIIFNVPANSVVLKIAINVITPFNGTNSSLSLGTTANNNLLVSAQQTDLSIAAKFEIDPNINVLVASDIYIFINAGSGTTQGNGWITLEYAPIN